MSFTQTSIGTAVIGAAILALSDVVLPQSSFMSVYDVRLTDKQIVADRRVHWFAVADWSVAVVYEGIDGPSCKTIPGPSIHEGWSPYEVEGRKESVMSLDVWVNDPGCYERLKEGNYTMYHTWTPRDGTPPVVFKTTFVKDG